MAKQVPLSAVARVERGLAALTVNHQGQFPSMTVSFNLAPGVSLEEGTAAVDRAVAGLHLPDTIRTEFGGDARDAQQSSSAQPLLILAALITVYIILGILYESLIHPMTIISTLPSAGLGALLALILSARPDCDRLHRHHPPDRHREEERDHDGGFRHPGGAARPVAGKGDPSGMSGAVPADHDDHPGDACSARCRC